MQIRPTSTGGTITWDSADWKAGLAPQGSLNNFAKYVGVNGFAAANIDPFRNYGVMGPRTLASSNATNSSSLTKGIVAMEMTDNSVGLGVDVGGKIQQITTSGATPVITTTGIYPHTLPATSPVGQDGILYRHNSGGTAPANSVVSFFYSYYNNSNWDVGALVNLTTFDDDFMTTVPTNPMGTGDSQDATQKNAPHFQEVGADGILYFGSGRYLHAYDGNTGNNGTFYTKVLTLPQGTQIVGLKKYKNAFLILCNYYSNGLTGSSGGTGTGQALLYTWNYNTLDIIEVTDLEDFFASAIFLWKGNPTVITSGAIERNGSIKVKVISGNSVVKVADFSGTIPNQRSVVVLNDVIYLNAGGLVVSVGDRYSESTAVNTVAVFGNSGFSGVLKYNELQTCLMGSSSASDGTGPVFNNINNGYGGGNARSTVVYPEFPEGKLGRVKSVTIQYYQPLAAGGTNGNFSFQVVTDSNTGTYTILANQSSVTAPVTKKYTRTSAGAILNASVASFSGVSWLISWNEASPGGVSPSISKIIIEYELLELKN